MQPYQHLQNDITNIMSHFEPLNVKHYKQHFTQSKTIESWFFDKRKHKIEYAISDFTSERYDFMYQQIEKHFRSRGQGYDPADVFEIEIKFSKTRGYYYLIEFETFEYRINITGNKKNIESEVKTAFDEILTELNK